MAEQIPFSVAETLLMKLGSAVFQEIGSMYGVEDQLVKLKDTLSSVRDVLLDAEEKQQEQGHAVAGWIRRLKNVLYDADDLLDDIVTEDLRRQKTDDRSRFVGQVSDFFSSSNHLAFRYEMGHRMKAIMGRLDDIANDMNKFKFLVKQTSGSPVRNSGRETCSVMQRSHKIVGRDENKKEIIELLMQSSSRENLSVVVITGIGGLGKTTLAQLVYNDQRVTNNFDMKMWVCVSDDFHAKTLIRNVIKSSTTEHGSNLESEPLEKLANRLQQNLEGKRYLLVLDDVWNEDKRKWREFKNLLPVGVNGSKILVTTRSRAVALAAEIDSPYVVEGLKEDESWDLFRSIVFRNGEEKTSPDLVAMGKDIVKMCRGVPLVVETLGSMLCFETQKSRWLSLKSNKNLLKLNEGNNILSVLRLSYDNLPTHLKQCFAYCALFPKDYEINKKLLVQLWMAQGYLGDSMADMDLEEIGNHYFDDLLARSLFVEVEKGETNNDILRYKMHDLIHDLAQSIVKSEVMILTDDVETIPNTVHHVSSFIRSNKKVISRAKSIRSLFIDDLYSYVGNNENWPWSNLKYLRVLKVCLTWSIEKIPTNWSKLSHLRFLDLSRSWFLKLPKGITRLKHLETLKLLYCWNLKEWPEDMKNLINLRHLEIDTFSRMLSYMPQGLRELTKLQSLPTYVVGQDNGERRHMEMGGGLSELKYLNNLRGQLEIVWISNRMRGGTEAKEAILERKEYLDSLSLRWGDKVKSCEEVVSIMESLKPHRNLKKFLIHNYRGERFPNWMMNDGLDLLLPNLVTIDMMLCHRIRVLPPFGQLPSLKTLNLWGFHAMKYIKDYTSSSSSSAKPFFPSLKSLRLGGFSNFISLPEWLPHASALQNLVIQDWPALTTLPRWIGDLTSLAELQIESCPKLTSLPQEMQSLRHLRKISIKHCGHLTRRCREEMGEDWSLISHIPQIDVQDRMDLW